MILSFLSVHGNKRGTQALVNIHTSSVAPNQLACDLLVIGVFLDEVWPSEMQALDAQLNGALKSSLQQENWTAKWMNSWSTLSLGKVPARRVAVLGLGERESWDVREARLAAGEVAQMARRYHATSVGFFAAPEPLSPAVALEAIADGVVVGGWEFAGYHQEPEESIRIQELSLMGLGDDARAIERGVVTGQAQNLVRELGMRPSNKLYPQILAEEAQKAGQDNGFDVQVFDEAKLRELGMEALLGVGQGSIYPPRLVVMRYQGGGERTLALVGKGITFDSGGISLKPGPGMEDMKFDMLGAGAVLGAMVALARLKVPLNVVGIMAIAQNMPSGSAYKPGDVVKAFNGKTIEVTNTDAEGRVVLSDAVSYAAHLKVDWIVETSTLTGAAVVVLGHEATALVSTDDPLASLVLHASESAGERVWRLPIYPEYKKLYRSPVADMKNSPGRDAGTITAGMIISEFAGSVPFAHLDIAGTAWTDKSGLNAIKNGPTGVMVRTFVHLADRLSR